MMSWCKHKQTTSMNSADTDHHTFSLVTLYAVAQPCIGHRAAAFSNKVIQRPAMRACRAQQSLIQAMNMQISSSPDSSCESLLQKACDEQQ